MQGFTAVFGLFMVPQRTERAAPLAYADAAAVAAAYAAARAARTPPPPPAGTLSEAQLRQLPAKEARRAPAAALSELPAPPAALATPAAPARSPPQPRVDKRLAQAPPSLGSCARRWRASTWSSSPAWTRTRSFARSPRRRRASERVHNCTPTPTHNSGYCQMELLFHRHSCTAASAGRWQRAAYNSTQHTAIQYVRV